MGKRPKGPITTLYLHDILANQRTILHNQDTIMAAIDDLNAITSKIGTDVTTLVGLASAPPAGTPDSAIEAAVAALTSTDNQITAAISALQPAAPAAP